MNINITKYNYILLGLIVILFVITRLYNLDSNPPSVYWDEASIGYNAYSILTTGKDEWGVDYPIHFKAFGEYKLPVYIYSTVPFIKMFGLNATSVRLPAVLYSLCTLLLVYLLAKKVSKKETVALFSAFFLTITPWFYIFSRTGYEATAGLAFYLLGLYLFLYSIKKPYIFILSSISLMLSFYSYNSFRVIVPILYIFLILLIVYKNRKSIGKIITPLFLSAVVVVLFLKPAYDFALSEGVSYRLGAVALKSTELPEMKFRKIKIISEVVVNIAKHFDPGFLFFKGDVNQRSQVLGFGQLYLFDALLLLVGVISIVKRNRRLVVLILLAVLGLIPSSITKEAPHALRSISSIPFIMIIIAYGTNEILKKFGKNKYYVIVTILLVYLSVFQLYLNAFNSSYLTLSSKQWQHSYKLLFDHYGDKFDKYDKILISDRYNQPYIFTLFYNKYNPEVFRSEVEFNQTGRRLTSLVRSFDKYIFTNIELHFLPPNSLVFAHPDGRLNELPVSSIILHNDGSIAFYVYEYEVDKKESKTD